MSLAPGGLGNPNEKWNWLLCFIYKRDVKPVERAHKVRILIGPEGPEAMEEILWMTFFPSAYDPSTSNVLDDTSANLEFETFYRDRIRKLLLVRGGSRYFAKANYDITRLAYLVKVFPDARFIVPIREPMTHIASLRKQHNLFLSRR